tara:strand:+ start:1809 stop:2516 length:708 start_codon:yes stop_codon:yes gene_type:complete
MNIDRFISNIKNLREAAPTNSVANGGVQNFDKFLFPRDEDLLSQDYQTPAEVGDSKDDFLGVYPVMKLQLDKSSDGPSIDSMVDASKEYFNKVTGPGSDAPLYSPIENIQNIVRGLKEDKELRKLASQERAAERKAEKDYRSKGRKVPEKKKGPKMSATPRPKRDGKDYADHILSSPSLKNMREDAPVNNVGGGHIAGAVPGEAPPVFKKKRNPTPVGRYGSRRMWLQDLKKNGK